MTKSDELNGGSIAPISSSDYLALSDEEKCALVAEKVCGLDLETIAAEKFAATVRKYRGAGYKGDEVWPDDVLPEKLKWFRRAPNYLTWQGMELVVEAMREKGYWTRILVGRVAGVGEPSTSVDIGKFFDGADWCAEASTAPEAVALASLRALGVVG